MVSTRLRIAEALQSISALLYYPLELTKIAAVTFANTSLLLLGG